VKRWAHLTTYMTSRDLLQWAVDGRFGTA